MTILTIEKERHLDGSALVSSFNHSYVQVKLGALLLSHSDYTVCSELSLDVRQVDWAKLDQKKQAELVPDLCLYPKRGLSRPRDILKMTEPPLLAIEIISPKQGSDDILSKFVIYFEMGVQSCWLVDPALSVVAVYNAPQNKTVFSSGEVIDEPLRLHVPLAEIFA